LTVSIVGGVPATMVEGVIDVIASVGSATGRGAVAESHPSAIDRASKNVPRGPGCGRIRGLADDMASSPRSLSVRDELLNEELFTGLAEAQLLIEQYRIDYNHVRPHSALRYRIPAEFAAQQAGHRPLSVASAPVGAQAFDHSHGWEEEINKLERILS
jgi:hypothetical protein